MSSLTPGPIVEEIAARCRYVPFAPAGLAFVTASTKARIFCESWDSPNETLPTEPCTIPAFSTRNSTEPPFEATTAFGDVHRHGADFRIGHQAARAEHLAQTSDERHHVRGAVAMQRSNSIVPPCTAATKSSAPTTSAPALRASSAFAPRANTPTRNVRPVPLGRLDDAAHHLVRVLGIDAEIRREFDRLVEFGARAGLDHLHRLVERIELGADDALARFSDLSSARATRYRLPHHLEAHRTGGTLDHSHRRLDRLAIEIDDLLLRDFAHLRIRHLADEAAAGRLWPPEAGFLPIFRPAAFFRKNVTGGWRISKVKERS